MVVNALRCYLDRSLTSEGVLEEVVEPRKDKQKDR